MSREQQNEAGHERRYPRGTRLVLSKKGEAYHLLAMLPPEGVDADQQARARKHEQQNLPAGFIPY